MTLGTRDMDVVGEVSGMVVVEAEDGIVGMESLLGSMEGVDLSSIGHRISRRGGYAETIIVSGPSQDPSPCTHTRLDNGYCSRGAHCKYSHGDDAVVPSQLMGMGSIPPVMLTRTLIRGRGIKACFPISPDGSHVIR